MKTYKKNTGKRNYSGTVKLPARKLYKHKKKIFHQIKFDY